MDQESVLIGVYVSEPESVAMALGRKLALRPIASEVTTVRGEQRQCIVLAGSDDPPWLALVSSRRSSDIGAALHERLPAHAAIRRLTCLTDSYERDLQCLESRRHLWDTALQSEIRGIRCSSVLVPALGLVVDLVERPHPGVRRDEWLPSLARMLLYGDLVGGHDDTETAAVSSPDLTRLARLCAPLVDLTSLSDAPMEHLAIDALDLDAAVQFSSELLGCRITDRFELPHETGVAEACITTQNGGRFSLNIGSTAADERHPLRKQIAERGGPGVHHVAHRVADLRAAVRGVEAAGGRLMGSVQETPGLQQVFVRIGESGTVHELVQRLGVTGFIPKNTAALMGAGTLDSDDSRR